jgi:hypothetical protein
MSRVALAFGLTLALNGVCLAHERMQPWPPADPDEQVTRTPFSVEWAKALRGFKTLADLQKAAGTKGHISERVLDDPDHPSVSFHWRSQPTDQGRAGWMLATVYADGGIGVGVITNDDLDVTVNNFGAFICEKCNPPVNDLGRTPSWSH